jgi:hypothetical protein
MCIHSKIIPTETVPGIRGGWIGREVEGRVEFKCDIFETL